jgi:hypothetical protein
MPRPDKIEAVKEITADLKATDVFYFVDYRGLTFAEATELHHVQRVLHESLNLMLRDIPFLQTKCHVLGHR